MDSQLSVDVGPSRDGALGVIGIDDLTSLNNTKEDRYSGLKQDETGNSYKSDKGFC